MKNLLATACLILSPVAAYADFDILPEIANIAGSNATLAFLNEQIPLPPRMQVLLDENSDCQPTSTRHSGGTLVQELTCITGGKVIAYLHVETTYSFVSKNLSGNYCSEAEIQTHQGYSTASTGCQMTPSGDVAKNIAIKSNITVRNTSK